MSKHLKAYRSPDGTEWGVEVELPGSSNAIIVFHHPEPGSGSRDRYVRFDWRGPEASDVTHNLDPAKVRAALNDSEITELFRRSMPIGSGIPALSPA